MVPATQEVIGRRILRPVQAKMGDPIQKLTKAKTDGDMLQVAEHLLRPCIQSPLPPKETKKHHSLSK